MSRIKLGLLAAGAGLLLMQSSIAQPQGTVTSEQIQSAQTRVLNAESFGRIISLIALEKAQGAQGAEIPIPVTVSPGTGGPGTQCVLICVIWNGVKVCYCA